MTLKRFQPFTYRANKEQRQKKMHKIAWLDFAITLLRHILLNLVQSDMLNWSLVTTLVLHSSLDCGNRAEVIFDLITYASSTLDEFFATEAQRQPGTCHSPNHSSWLLHRHSHLVRVMEYDITGDNLTLRCQKPSFRHILNSKWSWCTDVVRRVNTLIMGMNVLVFELLNVYLNS